MMYAWINSNTDGKKLDTWDQFILKFNTINQGTIETILKAMNLQGCYFLLTAFRGNDPLGVQVITVSTEMSSVEKEMSSVEKEMTTKADIKNNLECLRFTETHKCEVCDKYLAQDSYGLRLQVRPNEWVYFCLANEFTKPGDECFNKWRSWNESPKS